MKSKIFRKNNTHDPIKALNNARFALRKQSELKKIEQSLVYLNNSFNYNIQMQETYIDISKGKKKNINSEQIKKMYRLFSENKANQCIFLKTYNEETQVYRQRRFIDDDLINEGSLNSTFMNVIQEEEEPAQSQKNIIKNKSNNISKLKKWSLDSPQNQMDKNHKNEINSFQSIDTPSQNQVSLKKQEANQQLSFLLKRIYCRMIEKILVKIAFYTMNSKHLECIADNVHLITRSLQAAISKLRYLKDARFLHQTILKIYKQNFIIQAQIYKSLVNGGYIISVDEFYRVNGLDAESKQVYQRNAYLLEVLQKQKDVKKQQQQRRRARQLKKKQRQNQKQNKIRRQHLQKTNSQIQAKYKYCLYEMKLLLRQQQKEDIQLQGEVAQQEQSLNKNKKNSLDMSADNKKNSFKTSHPINRSSYQKNRPFRKSKFAQIKLNQIKKQNLPQTKQDKIFYETVSTSSAYVEVSSKKRRQTKIKSILPMEKRLSAFSSQFSKILKNTPNSKLEVSTKYLSEKFLQFMDNDKQKGNQISKQRTNSLRNSSKNSRIRKNKRQSLFQSIGINKILKLYQKKNSQNIKSLQQVTNQTIQQMEVLKNQYADIKNNQTAFCCDFKQPSSRNSKSLFYTQKKQSSIQAKAYKQITQVSQLKKHESASKNDSASFNESPLQNKTMKDFQRQYRYSLANRNQMDYYHKKKFNLTKKSPRFSANIITFNNFQNVCLWKKKQNNSKCEINFSLKANEIGQNSIKDTKERQQNINYQQNIIQIIKNSGYSRAQNRKSEVASSKSQKLISNQIKTNKLISNQIKTKNKDQIYNLDKFGAVKFKVFQRNLPSVSSWQKSNMLECTKYSIFGRQSCHANDTRDEQCKDINANIKNKIMRKAYYSSNCSPIKRINEVNKVILNPVQQSLQSSNIIFEVYDVRRKVFLQPDHKK